VWQGPDGGGLDAGQEAEQLEDSFLVANDRCANGRRHPALISGGLDGDQDAEQAEDTFLVANDGRRHPALISSGPAQRQQAAWWHLVPGGPAQDNRLLERTSYLLANDRLSPIATVG